MNRLHEETSESFETAPAVEVRCPTCRAALRPASDAYACTGCSADYPVIEGIPLLFVPEDQEKYRASVGTVQEYYRNVADDYARTHHVSGAGAQRFAVEYEARIAPHLQTAGRVLEVGAGTGFATKLLARHTSSLTASDASLEMLTRNQRANPGLSMFCCTTENLPFPDEAFDLVVGNNTYYLVPDKAAALRSIARVLEPGGRLIFSEMNPFFPLWLLSMLVRRSFFEAGIYGIFPWQVASRTGPAGMTLERVDFYSHAPYFASEGLSNVTEAIGGWLDRSSLTRRFAAIRIWYELRKQ